MMEIEGENSTGLHQEKIMGIIRGKMKTNARLSRKATLSLWEVIGFPLTLCLIWLADANLIEIGC